MGMRLQPPTLAASLDSNTCSCAILEWPGLEMICPPAMELGCQRVLEEGAAGKVDLHLAKGCTSSPWLSGRGPWLCITPSLSNRTASPLTGPCSSSVKTMSSGNMPKGSLSGHILQHMYGQVGTQGDVPAEWSQAHSLEHLNWDWVALHWWWWRGVGGRGGCKTEFNYCVAMQGLEWNTYASMFILSGRKRVKRAYRSA